MEAAEDEAGGTAEPPAVPEDRPPEPEADDAAPQLDFSGLDIDDLAPPGLESGPPAPPSSPQEKDTPSRAAQPSPGTDGEEQLEDLGLEGLPLEQEPPLAPADEPGAATGRAVKTGTALDAFDIDLGDLLTADELAKIEKRA